MAQKNILIGLIALVALFLLFTLTGQRGGEDMMDLDDEDVVEEMDEQRQGEDGENADIPTSADNAPEGSMHNLPVPEAVSAVKQLVATELGISTGTVIVMSAHKQDWSDGCLGLGGPAESCLFAITPGYEVTVQAQGSERVFRTNEDGTVIREDNSSSD